MAAAAKLVLMPGPFQQRLEARFVDRLAVGLVGRHDFLRHQLHERVVEADHAVRLADLHDRRNLERLGLANEVAHPVERGGQARAGAWTPADAARLEAIVERAHAMGLWVRFYTLNGHTAAENAGWTASYNFGSLEAVRPRWSAAIGAGVDFIATDQYEEFARVLSPREAR